MLAQASGFCHPLFRRRAGRAGAFWLLVLLALSGAVRPDAAKSEVVQPGPFSSAWSGTAGDKAQMRLIAGTVRGRGRYRAAAEIKLAGKAVTYWRVPGDAGVPPTFSFQGSTNLATADVAYPAPLRIDEQGLEAFGYRGDVTFPIAVTARDPAKPVRLRLTLDYAVCDNICLPARSLAELDLPQTGVSDVEPLIAKAAAQVPGPLANNATAQGFVITANPAAAQPTWVLDWNGPAAKDLFAEAPDGWDIETRRLSARKFSLVAVQQPPREAHTQVQTQLTLTTSGPSYVFKVELALSGRPPAATGAK